MNTVALLQLAITTSIMLIVAGLGMHARWQDAFDLFRHPRLLIPSLLSMNVIMPLVAVGLVVAFDLPLPVKIALVALAISPVPPLLPNKEAKAGGRVSYAIGLLTALAIFSIVIVPITVSLLASAFGGSGHVAPTQVAKVVLSSVLAPLAAGIAVRHFFPVLAAKLARSVSILGLVLLVVSALPLLHAVWPAARALIGSGSLLVFAAMAMIGLAVGHALGGPDASTRTVLALSTTSRHPAVALSVVLGWGVDRMQALAAVLLYVIVAMLISLPYVAWRRKRTSAAEPITTSP
jgi:bile acid:Na+ symporter, BASS family